MTSNAAWWRSECAEAARVRPCVELVNGRGVPGTAGGIVVGPDGTRFVLGTRHVLFGRGAGAGKPLWARVGSIRSPFTWIGRVAHGTVGRVFHRGGPVFVDCAVGVLDGKAALPPDLEVALHEAGLVEGVADARIGAHVTKVGAATGWTEGVVADVAYPDRPLVEDRVYEAPNQLLVRPRLSEEAFSAPGDSGALLLDERGFVVGLMWGCNANGEGIACPIAPVLACLGVSMPNGGSGR
jgi:hypothetical protein